MHAGMDAIAAPAQRVEGQIELLDANPRRRKPGGRSESSAAPACAASSPTTPCAAADLGPASAPSSDALACCMSDFLDSRPMPYRQRPDRDSTLAPCLNYLKSKPPGAAWRRTWKAATW
ncbi:hypothetical protein [Lysobacter gummosus]|uniref:hypothetical protein n=1 Tax=Lysobacter gummosus TaxID=262324 RepID=UPI00363FE4FE